MKKSLVVFCILGMLVFFSACSARTAEEESAAPQNTEPAKTDSAVLQNDAHDWRVIDGAGTKQLVLAGEKSGEVYTVNTDELTVFTDGEAASAADLKNGMILTVDAGYELLETWPAQIKRATVHTQSESGDKDDYGNICGLYLQVLEDLWTNDSALNADITYISVDLNKAPGHLTDGEKAAVTWIFSGRHNAQGLQFSFEELKENGYIDKSVLYWEDGVLFRISQSDTGRDTAQKITFNADKWRSGTGAIFYTDCTAKRGKGVLWEPYQSGGFAIS